MNLMRLFLLGSTALLLCCTASLQPRATVKRELKTQWRPYPVKNIALIPFISGPSATKRPYEAGTPPKESPEEFVTSAFYQRMLTTIPNVRILPLQDSSMRYKMVAGRSRLMRYKEDALRVCRAMEAQTALLGKVVTFREREGGGAGVSSPALVTFRVYLLECAGGNVIWEDYFSESQQSLLENVAEVGKFLKRGARWITAHKLALEGVTSVVKRLRVFIESG